MKVLILAAGAGSRLEADRPKVLLDVGGKSILQRHMDSLSQFGLESSDVTVVTGFMAGTLCDACSLLGVKTVHNPCWRFPGTCLSFLAQPETGEELLVLHGDLLWDGRLVSAAMGTDGGIVIPVDPSRRRDPEAMKAEARGGRLVHLSKRLSQFRSAGESMGIFLVRKHGRLRTAAIEIAGKPQASLDDAVNIAAGRMTVRVVLTEEYPWEEVDTAADLQRAGRLFG